MERDAGNVLDRYLSRVGLDGAHVSLQAIHRAHVTSIPFENIDVLLGRSIHLDVDSLVRKLIDQKRGGYCFEQNSLLAVVLERLGFTVTRCLGRVRTGEGPRPETHMSLLVDGQLVDVGFGASTPIGPIPLDGEATYGTHTGRTERVRTPEGEDAWLLSMSDRALYSFTELNHHPVDFLAPNHSTSTHPNSMHKQTLIVQRWTTELVQVGLVDLELLTRDPYTTTPLDPDALEHTLVDIFDLAIGTEDAAALNAWVLAKPGVAGRRLGHRNFAVDLRAE
ncbi:MAG: N-hydroxyarylamine O-acetyltransferase [Acidimicrobiaceae bacterium]